MKVYLGETSGIKPQPHPSSNSIAPKDRYYYQNRKAIVGFFNSPGLKSMGNRYSNLLIKEVNRLDLSHDWTKCEDLYSFIQNLLIGPTVEAMCGPVLLAQKPTFRKEFWNIDHDIFYFFKAYPRWLAPRAYRNRSKLLNSVKTWHMFARDNCTDDCIEPDGYDQYYG
ncbi:hypothetical protein N7G274_005435 [Stereocaulon virgatum]|uniref:Uncharacterized protein n=1 Tax=Stereocaulon virgatum TaxID=373712 RepID=A0ABR4A8B3_9LECA